jgi:inosose dehydratase
VPRVARRHARRLAHVHCKDVRTRVLAEARRSDRSFLEAVLAGVFTVPGDGGIDYGALLSMLKSAGYSGWLVVEAEQDPAVANPAAYARLGYRNLSRAAAAAGL